MGLRTRRSDHRGGRRTVNDLDAPTAIFTSYSVFDNITYIGYSVIGGVGSVLGAVFGGLLNPDGLGSGLLNTLFGIGPLTVALIGGIILLVNIIVAPDGIATMSAAHFAALRTRALERLPRAKRAAQKQNAYLEDRTSSRTVFAPRELAVNTIEVSFGTVRAVSGVDLEVGPGEVVGVIGANGAGKTTLIDAITGFVPSRGAIVLGDVDCRDAGAPASTGRHRPIMAEP